jgi:hypothetical protein
MPYRVTTRKRGGFEYTSLAETESAALVLARMMRRAGDEYCDEATVTVRDGNGALVAGWRGGYGWQPLPLERVSASSGGLQPLNPPAPATKRSARFATLPTDPMRELSMPSITEHSVA